MKTVEAEGRARWSVTTRKTRKIVTLPKLLCNVDLVTKIPSSSNPCTAVVIWGNKPSGRTATNRAKKLGLTVVRIEDGFLRSVEPAGVGPPWSIVVDRIGIYYDAKQPSELERFIATPLDRGQVDRVSRLQTLWQKSGVSKYNHGSFRLTSLPPDFVLVVDQTRGDLSIDGGLANAESFSVMLNAAIVENPSSTILIKVHPDVLKGTKVGYFDVPAVGMLKNVIVIDGDPHPAVLLKYAKTVYVVTSQLGFEALLWGRHVRTFGMPFYAGWGLTDDDCPAPPRRGAATLPQLIHGALIAYPRYVDPESNQPCEVERLILWLGHQIAMRNRFPEELNAFGFSTWKRPLLTSFLQGSRIRFFRRLSGRRVSGGLVLWGRRHDHLFTNPNYASSSEILRVEDGFLRSVGLGSLRTKPFSWVVDDLGIYYDATRPSRLETIISSHTFDPDIVDRAAQLIQKIQSYKLTKYNLGGKIWLRPHDADHVVLVLGQVEGDASLEYGTTTIKSNIDLLRSVRGRCKDSYIVYRPHPDVVAGARMRGYLESTAHLYCNEVATDHSYESILDGVDEVHVLTSLGGFEALIRGRKVVAYGQPFYAGWGLTEDVSFPASVAARRSRKVSLNQLAAATLIIYPTYVNFDNSSFTSPEFIVQKLTEMGRKTKDVSVFRPLAALINRFFWKF